MHDPAEARRTAAEAPTLHLAPRPGARYTPRHLPVRLTFGNDGDAPLRMLDRFEPLAVFFSVTLIREDETPIASGGGGKADFPDELTCFEVAPGTDFTVDVDLAVLLPAALSIPPGTYSLDVTYHNQYGEGCFHGQVQSTPLVVTLPA